MYKIAKLPASERQELFQNTSAKATGNIHGRAVEWKILPCMTEGTVSGRIRQYQHRMLISMVGNA